MPQNAPEEAADNAFVVPAVHAETLPTPLGRLGPGLREAVLLAVLYGFYTLTRMVAPDDLLGASRAAARLLNVEEALHIDVEHTLNNVFAHQELLAVSGSFYYAAAHYLVTPAVVLWLWLARPRHYVPARRALVLASLAALVCFVLVPTAPPRFVDGYHDVLAATADFGWWSTSASAPQGLGDLTNELAAMPSMHVGWALWVALAVQASARHWGTRALGWAHAVITTVVVIGTGNHWTLDVVVGAGLVVLAWVVIPGATGGGDGADGR